jgi:hypothetical protein
VPDEQQCENSGITVVQTKYQHTEMSDRGPEDVKVDIQEQLDKFLDDKSNLAPVKLKAPNLSEPGPVAQYAPVRN